MALQWRSDLAIGVEKVDSQHQQLFVSINNLLEACNQGKGKAEVTKTMDFLSQYVGRHFSDEEALQTGANYPGYPEHKALHDRFVQDFSKLEQQLAQEGASVRFVLQVNRAVVEWLVQHISKVDRAFGEYLHQRRGY